MSPRPTRANEDLHRIDDEGYELDIRDGYLIITHVPYVDAERRRRFGVLVYPLRMSGDVIDPPTWDHTIWFSGSTPCNRHGAALDLGNSIEQHSAPGVETNLRFSRKPTGGYQTHYDKVTTYVHLISGPAIDIDPSATAKTFQIIEPAPDESPFLYADTATARAGIARVAERLKMSKVAIVGLGGTGSYILDFVAKTPVWEIHLFDGDIQASHNAFRSPGAMSKEELHERPLKVDHLARSYSKMRRGIVAHGYLDESNAPVLRDMGFVFLSVDKQQPKRLALEALRAAGVPFVEVGMGLYEIQEDNALGGVLRSTLVTPENAHAVSKIDTTDGDEDEVYSQNIQLVELNAFNAAMAVMAWKRYLGFYKDLEGHNNAGYQITSNFMAGERIEGGT